jgi:hypothetical protein
VARGRGAIKAGGMGNATAPRAIPSLTPTPPGETGGRTALRGRRLQGPPRFPADPPPQP